MSGKPVVLTLLGCFWPGNDASGPNQSFIALASALQNEFDFRVVARDRAPGATPIDELTRARGHIRPCARIAVVAKKCIASEFTHDQWLTVL